MYVGTQKMGKRAALAQDQALNIKCEYDSNEQQMLRSSSYLE